MRSCPGCDYLVPAAWPECKRCGTALPRDARGSEPVRPASVATTASVAAVRPAAVLAAPYTPRYAGPAHDLRPSERGAHRRLHEPTREARRGRSLGSIVGVVALAVVVACGYFAWDRVAHPPVPKELQAWVDHGGGVTYAPSGGFFSVSLPATPTARAATVSTARSSTGARVAEADVGAHAAGVAWLADDRAALAQDADGMAHGAAMLAAQAAGFRVDVAESVTFHGMPAIDAEISRDGADGNALVVLDGTRVVAVYVLGTTHGGAGYDRIKSSLNLS